MHPLLEKNLISTKEASELSGYNSDYLARLCKSNRIRGRQIGRTWLVDKTSLEAFIRQQGERKVDRARALARAREYEYRIAQPEAVGVKERLITISEHITLLPESMPTLRLARTTGVLAAVLALLVLGTSVYASESGIIPTVAEFALTTLDEVRTGFEPIAIAGLSAIQNKLDGARIAVVNAGANVDASMPRTIAIAPSIAPLEFREPTIALAPLPHLEHTELAAVPSHATLQVASKPIDLALVAKGIFFGLINAPHAAIALEVRTVYAVPNAADVTSRVAFNAVGTLGNTLALLTARTPGAAIALAEHTQSSAIALGEGTARVFYDGEYSLAERFVAIAHSATSLEMNAIGSSGTLAYESYQAVVSTGGLVSTAFSSVSHIAAAPLTYGENIVLGTLGRGALALERAVPTQGVMGIATAVAAQTPALSTGQSAALTTYTTLHGLFDSTTKTLSFIFSPLPIIVLPNAPAPVAAKPTATSPKSSSQLVVSGPTYRTYSTVVQGVSQEMLTQSLASLKSDLLTQIGAITAPIAYQGAVNQTTIQQVNMIQSLTDLILHHPVIDGAQISSSNFSGSSVSATTGNFTTLTAGTSTFAGNVDATSFTINGAPLSAGGGTWGSITGTLSSQTDLQTALNSKFDLASWYATTTRIANGGTGTSTAPTYGKLLVGNASGTYDLVATSSLGIVSGGGSVTGVTGTYPIISSGGTAPAISLAFGTSTSNTWGGTQIFTTAPILGTLSGLLYGNNGTLATAATTTLTPSSEFTTTGTLGALIGGSNSTLALATNQTALSKLVQIAANTILGNFTGATGNITAFATSSLGVALSDTTGTLTVTRGGTGQSSFTSGNLVYGAGSGALQNVATSSVTNGAGISFTGTPGALVGGTSLTITNTGLLSLQQLGGGTAQTGAITFATSSQTTNGQTIGLNITNATGAFTFAPTLSGTLGVGGGGTGQSSFTSGNLLYGAGSGAVQNVATSSVTGTSITVTGSAAAVGAGGLTVNLNLSNPNTFTALQQFNGNASTTGISATYASSTNAFLGNLSIANLSGVLRAAAGAVSTGAVNLASEVSGLLGVASGGTGWGAVAANSILLGNGTGALSTTSAGTNGQVLALVNGVPTWAATTTLSTISGTLGPTQGGTGLGGYNTGDILYADAPNHLTALAVGSNGTILKLAGGIPTWGTDLTTGGGGGAGAWSTTTDSLAVYPTNTSNVIIVGSNATSSQTAIFEVHGKSYFNNNVGIGTTSPSFPLSVNGNSYFNGDIKNVANITATGTVSVGALTLGSLSGLLYGNSGPVSSVATSSFATSGEFSYTGTLGSLVGGANGTLSLATNQTALSKLVQVAANTILGNNTGATGNVVAFATSTLGIALSDTTGTLALTRGGTGTSTAGVTNGVEFYDGSTITNTPNLVFNNSTGALTVSGSVTSGASVTAGAANSFSFLGRSAVRSSVNGRINLTNNTAAGFTGLTLGLETSSFPYLKVNGAGLDFRVGDDTAYTNIAAQNIIANGNVGIGTTTPGVALSLAGAAGGTKNLLLVSTSTSGFATSTAITVDQNGNLLLSNGATLTAPSLSLTNALTVANGGTGQTSFTSSNLIYGAGSGALQNVATTSETLGSEFSFSGTLGARVGGASGTLTLATNQTALPKLVQVAANTILGNNTGATGNVVAFATSSLGIALSDTRGTLAINRGGTATTTFYNGGVTFYNSTLGTLSQGTTASDFFYDVTNKRLGLGTSTPYATLSVSSASQTSAITPLFAVGSTTNASLFTILANGSVGIGTAAPTSALSIVGQTSTASTLGGQAGLTVTGGTGFSNAGAGNGTNGGLISLTAGNGGNSAGSITNAGYGGGITLLTGSSGVAATGFAGNGGDLSLGTGGGGTANHSNNGGGISGNVSVFTGSGGDSYGTSAIGGNAGNIQLSTGNGGNATNTSAFGGSGGGLIFATGSGGQGASTGGGGSGGTVQFLLGSAGAGRAGGSFTVLGGTGSTTGTGGSIQLDGGVGGSSSVAGNILLGSLQGLVGIGTTSPYAQLSVSSPIQQAGGFSLFSVASTSNATLFNILGGGNVGIGTSTPGSLLSLGGSGTGWNFYDNATTTKNGVGGVNILQGCFAVNGVCVGTTATGVTSIQQLGGGTAQTGAITFATSSQTTNGQTVGLNITNASGAFTFAPTISGTLAVAGGGTGVSTFTSGQLLYGNGTNALSSVATTTFTPGSEFTTTGTLGALIGGSNSTLALATNQTALSKLVQIGANTILGNNTGATGNVVAFATSSLGIALSDTTGTLGVSRGGTGTGTTFTQGSAIFAGASGIYSQDNANYFYDATNHRLGIGTTSPYAQLSVTSSGQLAAGSTLFAVGSTTNSSLFNVLANGNVGIGTTSPSASLSVNGNTLFNGNIVQTSPNTTVLNTLGIASFTSDTGGVLYLNDSIGTAAATAGAVNTNSILVETTVGGNPSWTNTPTIGSNLTVNGAIIGSPLRGGTAAASNLSIVSTSNNSPTSASTITFGSGSSVYATFSSTGNFGLGTTSPGVALSLAGAAGGTKNLLLVSTSTSAFATSTAITVDQNGNLSLLNGATLTTPNLSLTNALTVANGGTGQTSFTSSNLIYGAGSGALQNVATTSETLGSEFSFSGTLGARVGGASGTLTLATNQTALSKLVQVAANTILGNNTGATGNVVAFATSTLGIALSDTTGTLAIARGGTNATSQTTNGVNYFDGSKITSGTTFTFDGANLANTSANGTFNLGGATLLPNTGFQFSSSTNSFVQNVVQNTNAGNNASADFIVNNNLSTNSTYYGDLGINGGSYSQGNGESANDVFLAASDANLDLETSSSTGPAAIQFFTAGNATSNLRAIITNTGNFGIGTTTPGTALGVQGTGVFAGNVFATNITATSTLTANSLALTNALTVANGGTGKTTFTSSQLVYGNGTNALTSVATTTFTPSGEFTVGGTIGALVGGANSTLALANNGVALSKLSTIAANTILGNNTGATGNVVAFATSSLGIAFSDTTGTVGVARGGTGQTTFTSSQLVYGNGTAALTSVATTSATLGLGLSYSGTLGALVGGASGSLTIATSSLYSGSAGQLPYFSASNTLTGTSSLFLAANGSFGIGTSTPGSLLSIGGTGTGWNFYDNATTTKSGVGGVNILQGCFSINGTCVGGGGSFFNTIANGGTATTTFYGGGVLFYNSSLGTLSQASAQTGLFFDNTNQRLGVGTTTPVGTLGIQTLTNQANAFSLANSIGSTTLSADTLDTAGNIFSVATTSGSDYLDVQATGNIAFGTSVYTSCTGLTTNASGVIQCSVSDQHLKQNITTLDDTAGLSAIRALNPVSFTYIDPSRPQGLQYGVIAQQVQQVLPNLVASSSPTYLTPNGTLTVNYEGLIAPLIRAVQELDARTSSLATSTATSTGSTATSTAPVSPIVISGSNVGVGIMPVAARLQIAGNILADEYDAPLTSGSVFTYGSSTLAAVVPANVLTAGGAVDLYKLATYNLSGITLLASAMQADEMRITSLEDRVAALESGAVSTATSTSPFSTSTLASAFNAFGAYIAQGIAQFGSLVADQFVAATNSAGTSSAGSGSVLAGNTTVIVQNAYVHPSSKIFVTFTGEVAGGWYLSDKQEGSFRLTLPSATSTDISFDYFIVQTLGQVATSTAPVYTPPVVVPPPVVTPPPPSSGSGSGSTTPPSASSTPPTASSTPPVAPTTAPPTVTLNGSAAMQINQGDVFTDPGASALDYTGADISSSIVEAGSVDAATAGSYTLTYTVIDSVGNTGSASRLVNVVAPAPPPTTATSTPPAASGNASSTPVGG